MCPILKKTPKITALILFGFLFLWKATIKGQEMVPLYPVKDAFIAQEAPDNNFGTGSTMLFGKHTYGEEYRPLLQFDLSSIPGDATITNAFLTITRYTGFDSETVTGTAFRITSGNWSESTVKWSSNITYDSSVGGIINASSTASSINIQLTSITQKWINDGPTKNYGIIFVPSSSSANGNEWWAKSRESSTEKPRLTVYYCTPSSAPTGISANSNPSCPGSSVTLTRTGGSLGAGASWAWYSGSCGGTYLGTGSSITVKPSSQTTYYVRAENYCNETSCASITISMKNSSTAATSATANPSVINSGAEVELSRSGGSLGAGASWVWYSGSCGGTYIATGSTITVSPVSNTTYFVRAEGDCNTTACVSASVTVNPIASIGSVIGNSPICIGESATYTANNVVLSGGTGAWSSSNTEVATVNSSGIVTGVSAGTCYIKYEITGGYGGTVSKQQAVSVYPNASIASVTGQTELCIGDNAVYTANSVITGGGSGTWSSSDTGVATVNSSGTVTAIVQGTTNIIYTITSGCGGTVSSSLTVTVRPENTIVLASPTGADDQSVCISTPINNIVYTTTGATGTTFTGLPSGITGQWENNLITISGSPAASGVFDYSITLTGGCGIKTDTGKIAVTPNNTITLSAGAGSDDQSICENTPIETIDYFTTRATGASFTGLPPGVTGAWNEDTAHISGVPNQAGTFNYSVTLSGGCGTISATGVIASNPDAGISSVTGPGQVCLGSTAAFTANGVELGGGTGAWSISNASVATVSSTGAVTGVSVGTCNIIYTITDGCGGEVSAQHSVDVVPTPSGGAESLTICSDVSLDYDIQESNINILGNSELSTFSWIATPNQYLSGESATAKTTSVIDDKLSNISGVDQTTIYTVIPTGTNGCKGDSISVSVTVKSEPVGMDEDLVTCSDTELNYNLQTANINLKGNGLASTFVWAAAANSSITGSSQVEQITDIINDNIINSSGAEQSVLYSVTPTGTNSCIGKPFTISVRINPSPTIVIKWDDVLICSNAHNLFETYQWLRNEIPIDGAKQQYYTTSKQSGKYRVETTDVNGCSSMSNEIVISGTKSLSLYPNPTSNSFIIDLDDTPSGKALITIFDGSGKKMKEIHTEKKTTHWQYEIPVNDLNEGTHLVIVSVEDVNIYHSKIVVIKRNSEEYYEK